MMLNAQRAATDLRCSRGQTLHIWPQSSQVYLLAHKTAQTRSHSWSSPQTLCARRPEALSLAEPGSAAATWGDQKLSGPVKLVAVVPVSHTSPYSRNDVTVSWAEVYKHIAKRLQFIDPDFQLQVFTDAIVKDDNMRQQFDAAMTGSAIVVANGMFGERVVDLLAGHCKMPKTKVFLDSAPRLRARTTMGGISMNLPSAAEKIAAALPRTRTKEAVKLWNTVERFFFRHESDDLLFMFLVLIDAYVRPVPWVQRLRAAGIGTIVTMMRKCGKQVLACLQDPECKAALDCLEGCAPNDQVCSYRCIVSHETSKLEDFTLCVLQRNNCLGLCAEIPERPNPNPMSSWRGSTLTHESAEEIFMGWLGDKKWSWRVVAGQNAAYDQFSNQYQLYYRGKGKGQLWYDPVFQVRTLAGEKVWRRRHYRVRRAKEPGTFHFSVLDNGVISKEFWRILDATDDLSWALFFYAGAASAAGQAYTGAVLVTPDGKWPDSSQKERLQAALGRASIEQWELFQVDNTFCEGAPLELPGADSQPNQSLRELATSGKLG